MFVRRVSCLLLLALCGLSLLSLPLVQAETAAESEWQPSERLLAELELDKLYQDALPAEEPTLAVPKNSAYSAALANKLFWHSVSSYCSNLGSLQSWSCPSCSKAGSFHPTGVVNRNSNQGYVGYGMGGLPAPAIPGVGSGNDPYVLLSFRGSANLGNWIENLSFSKFDGFSSKHPSVKVHAGFWAAWNNVKAGLMPGLNAALSASGARTIIVVGHSLGGAMANVAALDLKVNHFPGARFATYTMGAPRVGDANWVNLFTAQIDASFREVHQADIVAHLPPLLLNFQHEPLEVFYNGAFNSYKVCNDVFPGESKSCSNAIPLPTSITDHTHYRGISIGGWCNAASLTTEMDGEEEVQTGVEDAEEIDSMLAGMQRAQQVEEREEMPVQGEVSLREEAALFSEQETELELMSEEEQIRRGKSVQQRLEMQEAEQAEEMEQTIRGLSIQQRLEQQEAEEEEQISRGLSIQQRLEMQEETELISRGLAMQQRLDMQEAEEELPVLSKLTGLKRRRISLNIDIDLSQ